MGMGISLLQQKIESLQNLADSLLHIGDNDGYVYADDLSQLNKKIHEKIEELYPLKGGTEEQEAALCLAILSGYSVSMYANPEDERKKKAILKRAKKVVGEIFLASPKFQQLAVFVE